MNSIKAFLFVGVIFMLLCAAGCKKTKNGNFTLQVTGSYGNYGLVEDSLYQDPQGRYVSFSHLQFYLSNITLIKTDGSQLVISPVSFFSFDAPQALTLNVANIDGNFKAITFGCGLDSIQNRTGPNSVAANNPLSGNYNMWWLMIGGGSYQFEHLDGYWYNNDTSAIPAGGLGYHVGTNAVYHQTTVNQNFSVCCDKGTTLTLSLDVKKLFYGSTLTLNVSAPGQESSQMGPEDTAWVGPAFATNFSQAFSVK